MKKSIVISLHIGYWFIYLLFKFHEALLEAKGPQGIEVIRILFYPLAAALICFYSFYFILTPKFLAKKKVTLFILYGVSIGVAISLIEFLIQTLASKPHHIDGASVETPFAAVFISLLISLIISSFTVLINGLIATLIKGFIIWYDEIHMKEMLKSKNLQTELALVKAQINPHFLFNTLNNIDILIEKNAETASAYLKKLSDIMRFTLYETPHEMIPLSKELEYIGRYIDLQSLRTTNNNFVFYNVTGENKELQIPPMIFISFIENAFKHSVNKKIDAGIVIKIEITENKILFFCKNIINTDESDVLSNRGIGIELIRHRLELLYKEDFELKIQKTDKHFEVHLTINPHAN